MAKTEPQSTAAPDFEAVKEALRNHDGEATTGEVASDLGVRPSAVQSVLAKLVKWEVVTPLSDSRWRLASIEKHQTVGDFEEQASDRPCPLGCGYRPLSARDAGAHLLRHLTGTHTTGEQQYRNRAEYVD